jgi:hypothetical protein
MSAPPPHVRVTGCHQKISHHAGGRHFALGAGPVLRYHLVPVGIPGVTGPQSPGYFDY